MIDEFEKAKSNRSKCSRCEKEIRKDEIRGIEYFTRDFELSQRYYCLECSGEILKETKKELDDLVERFHWAVSGYFERAF